MVVTLNNNAEEPISPNPLLEQGNATHLTLKWSSPFLWPGVAIDYYNVSVRNTSDQFGGITYYQVNTTFSEAVVMFTFSSEDSQNCTLFSFGIVAVRKQHSLEQEGLRDFSIAGGFASS